jgi:formate hydrogenlyase subunit 3/multisubunit Na+/H+ antiporter MnhD subunit
VNAWLFSVPLLPLLLALLSAVPTTRAAGLRLAPWAALPAVAVALAPLSAPAADLPALLFGLRFGLDATGRTFLLFTALLWLVAGIAARAYHAGDGERLRLWICWLLTLGGNLWLVLAQDAPGFYTGFALMTFSAYGLVVHTGSVESWRAGRAYLVMALLGEAALLAGLLLAVSGASGIALPLRAWGGPHAGLALVLLFAGFGVKAGVAGLHLWLPLAHPVAPTPASAVLSGAMIKAGVLGWLRFLPIGAEAWPIAGTTIMVLALAALFGAVAVGTLQRDPKTQLAYSSVSQMGFMTLGIGAALAYPPAAPALTTAVTVYALHHALAKGALFLGVAALPVLARRSLAGLLVLPALALAGAPLTSGALAKQQLKAALAPLTPAWTDVLSWLLPLAAAGTSLLMARFVLTLRGRPPAPKPGLALPWTAAVACSMAVPGWVAGGLAPWPLDPGDMALAMLPIVAGTMAGWWLHHRASGGAHPPPIPAGDLLVPIERVLGLIGLAMPALLSRLRWPALRFAPLPGAEAVLQRIERGMRSPLGAGLLMLLVLVALAAGA